MAVIGCVFCTFLLLMASLFNVWFWPIFYGHFFNYVELDIDLGGLYFASSLKHVQQGVFISVAFMVAVLDDFGYDCLEEDFLASACDCFGMFFLIVA